MIGRGWVAAALEALGFAGGAQAADRPVYAPPPAWVAPTPIPFGMKPSGAAADVLLLDQQMRLDPGSTEVFLERAVRVNSAEGLGSVGNLIQVWDPQTDTLTIHRARIIRQGEAPIDLLAGGRTFTVLRREPNLEAAMIDGELTATLQPEGLRVGDVLDTAVTLSRREPAWSGHAQAGALLAHSGVLGRLLVRASWPKGDAVAAWRTDDLPAPTMGEAAGRVTATLDLHDSVTPDPPKGAPVFDQMRGVLEFSDFGSWRTVSAVNAPLYAKAEALGPASPLKPEIERIRRAAPTPKAQALAALQLVEGQVRYLYLGLDAGGYTPAPADQTWSRRFGDCKGKTTLLLALLHGLGVQAVPALVSTGAGHELDRQLPAMDSFDHVVVRATIGGEVYWLDATRLGDENLDVIPIPDYGWALPVRAEGAELERLTPRDLAAPILDTDLTVDARAGLERPAKAHVAVEMRGDVALVTSLALKQASRDDRDRALRRLLTAQESWITPSKVDYAYDGQRMELRISLDGTGLLPFTDPSGGRSGVRDLLVAGSSLGYEADLTRTSDFHRNAPYAVGFPAYARSSAQIELPDGGRGFDTLNGDPVSRTLGAVTYTRTAIVANGRFAMVASTRSLGRQFPASEAPEVQAGLRSLADYPVSLRFDPAEAAPARKPVVTPAAPTDPQGAADQAFADKDYAAAERGFSALLAEHPSARLYYDRAAARLELGQSAAAEADLRSALALDPRHTPSLLALGRIAIRDGREKEAAARFRDATSASKTPEATAEAISEVYAAAHRYLDAAHALDQAAAAVSPSKPRDLAEYLNVACWDRARADSELEQAVKQCDAALELKPGAGYILDSRALAELRLHAYDKALADYDAALAKRPGSADSLFGRALVKARLSRADAEADFQAASAADPKVAERFAAIGLKR